MSTLSGDISQMIFRRVIGDHLKEVSLNGRLLAIFLDMDGKKNLGAIAQAARMNSCDLQETVSRLLKLELIEQVSDNNAVVDDEFLNFLRLQLAKAIGPLSTILVEDSIQAAGYSQRRFPAGRAGELVETLAKDIQRETKRHQFKNDMYRMIQQKGYALPLL
jgi:hypothetical protein